MFMESWAARPKKLYTSVEVTPAPVQACPEFHVSYRLDQELFTFPHIFPSTVLVYLCLSSRRPLNFVFVRVFPFYSYLKISSYLTTLDYNNQHPKIIPVQQNEHQSELEDGWFSLR